MESICLKLPLNQSMELLQVSTWAASGKLLCHEWMKGSESTDSWFLSKLFNTCSLTNPQLWNGSHGPVNESDHEIYTFTCVQFFRYSGHSLILQNCIKTWLLLPCIPLPLPETLLVQLGTLSWFPPFTGVIPSSWRPPLSILEQFSLSLGVAQDPLHGVMAFPLSTVAICSCTPLSQSWRLTSLLWVQHPWQRLAWNQHVAELVDCALTPRDSCPVLET